MTEPSRAELKYHVERQREEMRTLNEMGKLLNASTTPDDLFRQVTTFLERAFPVALYSILIFETRRLVVVQFATIADMALATARRDLLSIANELRRQPLNPQDVRETVEDRSGTLGQMKDVRIAALRSSHHTPLRVNREAIGLLSLYSGKEEAFSKDDRHAIDIVGDHLGAALRNTVLMDQLRRAGEMKNDLLMLISHELHTPLTAIKEGTSLILEGALGPTTEDQREFLRTVNESTGRLETLIEKVLLATQLLTGSLRLERAPIDVSGVLRRLEARFRPAAEARKLSMEFAGLAQPLPAHAEAARLEQALAQILENAIHATGPDGFVTVRAAVTTAGVELRIADTGAGIPAEDVPTIFEHFQYVGTIDDRKTGGLGLGFFIARGLIEAHGGTITLASQQGQGTTVTIALPKPSPASAGG